VKPQQKHVFSGGGGKRTVVQEHDCNPVLRACGGLRVQTGRPVLLVHFLRPALKLQGVTLCDPGAKGTPM